jgi:hypothetical protein
MPLFGASPGSREPAAGVHSRTTLGGLRRGVQLSGFLTRRNMSKDSNGMGGTLNVCRGMLKSLTEKGVHQYSERCLQIRSNHSI